MRELTVLEPEVLPSSHLREPQDAGQRTPNRRRTYQVLLPLAALSLLPGLVTGQVDAYDRVTLPLLALLLCGVWALVFRPLVALPLLNVALLSGLWSYFLGRLAFVLFWVSPEQHLLYLSGTVPWMLMALVSHTWMLGTRLGQVLSRAVLGLMALLVLVYLLSSPDARHDPMGWLLLQTLLAGAIALAAQRSALHNLHLQLEARRMPRLAGGGAWTQDALTGLPDQRVFEHLLGRGFAQRPAGLAVAVVSLDHLERVQETHDPAFTQHLTAHVGRVLAATVRDADTVACLQDGHFAVLLRVPDCRAAKAACERLRVRVASRPLEGLNPTVSVGLAFYDGSQTSGQALLSEAHWALSTLRKTGFNRVLLASQAETKTPHGGLSDLQAV